MTFDIEKMRKNRDGGTTGWRVMPDPTGEPALCVRSAELWDVATIWGGYSCANSDVERIKSVPSMEAEIERLTSALEGMIGPHWRDAWDSAE